MSSVPSALQQAIGQAQADYAAANPVPSGVPATPPPAPAMPISANPYTENPAAPIGAGAPAMPIASSPTLAQPPITGLSSKTGVSGSIASQMDKAAAANPNPSAPGAWARNALAGVQSALANANIGEIPKGGGAINGITMAAANAQKARAQKQAQAQAAAVAQSEIEKNHEEALDANHRRYVSEHLAHLTENKANISNGKDTLRLMASQPSAPDVLHEGLTWEQAQTLAAQNKLDMAQNHAYPDGEKQVGEDAEGNPIMQTTYTVVGNMKDVHLNTPEGKDFIERWNAIHPDKPVDETTVIPGARFANIEQGLNDVETATAARDESLLQAGIKKDDLDQKLEMVKLGPDWNVALAAAGGDPAKAVQAIMMNPRTAKLYPHIQKDVQTLYGGETGMEAVEKDIEAKRHNIATEQEKAIADNAKLAATKKDEALGDVTKTGDDYMQSLASADPGEAALVRDFGSGRMAVDRVAYLAAKNPRILQEVSLAFPDINTSAIAGYQKVYNDFKSGKTADQILAVNTAVPHLAHLYDAVNAIPTSGLPFIGASDTFLNAEAKSGSQAARALLDARTQAGQELSAIYSKGAVTDQEYKKYAEELETTSPQDLRNSVKEILDLLQSKQQALNERWTQGAPSAQFHPPIRIVSPDAQGSMDRIYLMHDNHMNPGSVPPAAVLGQVQPGYVTTLGNGQQWTRGQGEDRRPILLNPPSNQ